MHPMQESPIAFELESEPYNPNDEAAVATYWMEATVKRGPGWQTRINALLRKAVKSGL